MRTDVSGAVVLLVEDFPPEADRARRALEASEHGFVVRHAEDARSALDLLEPEPDLLIVDQSLPRSSGLGFISDCRRLGVRAPAILVTGAGSERTAAQALKAGVSEYVIKGVGYNELLPFIAADVIGRWRDAERLDRLDDLMLDVSLAGGADDMATRIAAGARSLLAAPGAIVWRENDPPLMAVDGRKPAPGRRLERALRTEHDHVVARLAVALPDDHELSREEERVTNLFVRFAATALENALLLERERAHASRLEELDRLKSEFLSRVSHELLTPLTMITGFARTVHENWDRLNPDQRRDYVACIIPHADELTALIRRLLEFSRLEGDAADALVEPVALTEAIDRVVEQLEAASIERGPCPGHAAASTEAVESIVANLIANALKFARGHVHVWTELVGDGVVIVVDDDGPGVPAGDRDRIFGRFVRGDGIGEVRGSGIGLAIVERYASTYGGSAWVQDSPRGGASFRVSLPAARAGVTVDTVLR